MDLSKRMDSFLWMCMILVVERLLLQVTGQTAGGVQVPPVTTNIVDEFQSTSFSESFTVVWGQQNIVEDGDVVRITLDRNSGAGFKSRQNYVYGFINAAIKLPPGYSAGVVTAFYTSNDDIFPRHHDELDFEFLGVIPGESHMLQTNVYMNGSTDIGREERLSLWFDPSEDFHNYSILWTHRFVIFFVDNIPIRRLMKKHLRTEYPAKPTSLHATIWDGSQWATDGGKYPLDYSKGPYQASFTNFKLQGCESTNNWEWATCASLQKLNQMVGEKTTSRSIYYPDEISDNLEWVRKNYMTYSYCDDAKRYPIPLPECSS